MARASAALAAQLQAAGGQLDSLAAAARSAVASPFVPASVKDLVPALVAILNTQQQVLAALVLAGCCEDCGSKQGGEG